MLPREFARIARAERQRREEERAWSLLLINHVRGAVGEEALTLEDMMGAAEDDGGMSVEEFGAYIDELRHKRRDSR